MCCEPNAPNPPPNWWKGNAGLCPTAEPGEGVAGVYGKAVLGRQRDLARNIISSGPPTAASTASHLRNPADDVATHRPGVSNSSGVVTTGVVSCELLSSISGLCRGEGCASPSDTDSRLLLRREYLWIPHLSKRDLYARVLDSGQIGVPQITCSIHLLAQPLPLHRPQDSETTTRELTYDALNPYFCIMTRWTSWSGLFWSLYSAMMASRYLSHCFVMACQFRPGGKRRAAPSPTSEQQASGFYKPNGARLIESGVAGE